MNRDTSKETRSLSFLQVPPKKMSKQTRDIEEATSNTARRPPAALVNAIVIVFGKRHS